MNKLIVLIICLTSLLSHAGSTDPDCTKTDSWPASMAFVHLKNAGLLSNESVNFLKTTVVRLSSEKIKKDLYNQIHKVVFTLKTGEQIKVITSNDASPQECSMSSVKIYVISQELGSH